MTHATGKGIARMSFRRRRLLGLLALGPATTVTAQTTTRPSSTGPTRSVTRHSSPVTPASVTRLSSPVTRFSPVVPGYRLRFPEDEGSHPDFRTEWWYITGWLQRATAADASAVAREVGFQVTFFRTRLEIDERNPSAFTPRQIVIAHAAISDGAQGHLLHDQKVARAVLGLANAEQGRTNVWIGDWSLMQQADSSVARISSGEFALDLRFKQTQPPLLQGDNGFSRKGPREESASYYYSFPHLQVTGSMDERSVTSTVTGTAWLDHEWSSSYMDERASGWDWVGVNLDDGGALMAFRMRDANGAKFWAACTYRAPDGTHRTFGSNEVDFVPLRTWRSPRNGAVYPVACRIDVPGMHLSIEPLMDDQEQDTRLSVGTVYWEGAVIALREGKPAGRGYLELTGYSRALKGLTGEKSNVRTAPAPDRK